MERLTDEQLKTFDTEHVYDQLWVPIKRAIDKDFSDGNFCFFDIGGGNGVFADRVLDSYPRSTCVVFDNSRLLLEKNKPHPRKRIIHDSVENLKKYSETKYDIVFLNWLLHHLVDHSSYTISRDNITCTLRSVKSLLKKKGRISVYENMYNGLIIDGLPSWLIYRLTSSRILAKVVKKFGANTAGTGVCFLSNKQWYTVIKQADLHVISYAGDASWPIPWVWVIFLHIKNIRFAHFWLSHD